MSEDDELYERLKAAEIKGYVEGYIDADNGYPPKYDHPRISGGEPQKRDSDV
jgi:hypothetical protein